MDLSRHFGHRVNELFDEDSYCFNFCEFDQAAKLLADKRICAQMANKAVKHAGRLHCKAR